MNIAENSTLHKHPYYSQIRTIIAELNSQNLIHNGAGFCYAMSDLLYHKLQSHGVKSSIIEFAA